MSRYYCTHGSYSEYDRQRCKPCKERARVIALGPLRSCSDCIAYVPATQMIPKPDGRVICPGCERRLERAATEKAQENLFTQQLSLI